MAFKSETRDRRFLPYDANPEWREIYDRLAAQIGGAVAYSWFGPCKFVRLQSDTLELAHWIQFGARECTGRYGVNVAMAARVKTVRIYRSGGFVPHCITEQIFPKGGYEEFHMFGDNVPREKPEAA
jgi:hypothetical protein